MFSFFRLRFANRSYTANFGDRNEKNICVGFGYFFIFQLSSGNCRTFTKQWTFNHEVLALGQVSEIPAFDKRTNTLWVGGVVGVDVLDAETGMLVKHIST